MDEQFIEKLKAALWKFIEEQHGGNISNASKALGLSEGSGLLWKWTRKTGEKGERCPSMSSLGPRLGQIGVTVIFPDEANIVPSVDSKELDRLRKENEKLKNQVEILQETLRPTHPKEETQGGL